MVEYNLRELHKETDKLIDVGLWAVVSIFDAKPAFAYTVGLHSQNLPELIMVGLPSDVSHGILNAVGRAATNVGGFMHGNIIEKTSSHPITVIDALDKEEYATQVYAHYRTWDFKLQQLVVPDTKGRFPWDEDYDKILLAPQLILGNPPTRKRTNDQ